MFRSSHTEVESFSQPKYFWNGKHVYGKKHRLNWKTHFPLTHHIPQHLDFILIATLPLLIELPSRYSFRTLSLSLFSHILASVEGYTTNTLSHCHHASQGVCC